MVAKNKTENDPVTTVDRLLTTEDVAERLQVSVSYLSQLRARKKRGGLPFIRIGRAIRYDPSVVEEWISKNSRQY